MKKLFLLGLTFLFSVTSAQTCADFVIERSGVEYLRINGTNNLWGCSSTNLCNRIANLETETTRVIVSAFDSRGVSFSVNQVHTIVFQSTIAGPNSGAYDSNTGKFTAPFAGWYQVQYTIMVRVGGGTTYEGSATIMLNGGEIGNVSNSGTTATFGVGYQSWAVFAITWMNVGDVVTFSIDISSTGSTLSFNPDGLSNSMYIIKVA